MKNTLTFKYFEQKRQADILERLDKKVDLYAQSLPRLMR